MADVVLHPTTSALLLQDLQNELIKGNRPVVPLTGVGILQEKRAPVPLEALPAPITLLALRRLAMPDDIGFVAIDLLYAPFICDTTHCSIIRFRGASRLARPSQEGEKMTTVWASRHEDLVSHDGVSPHVCDPMVVPHGEAVLEWGNPAGSAGDTCRDAAA